MPLRRVLQLELRDLEVFVGAAEAGGFRRAASQIGVRQSVISVRRQRQ